MAAGYRKRSIKVPAPKKGLGKFARTTSPKLQPLKTRIYTKDVLRNDPSEYGSFGFGDTGLRETPSLLGIARSGARLT